MDLVYIVVLVFILVKLSSLGSRLNELEKGKSDNSQKVVPDVSSPTITQAAAKATGEEIAPSFSAPPPVAHGTPSIEKFFAWYAHEWMLKTGALFILMGFLWFVTYAFLNNWIGPVGRITIGMIAGAAILFGGEMRLRKVRTQGITLVWLGTAVMTITIYAAQYYYHMFPSFVALLFLGLNAAATAFISLRHNSLSLSIAALTVGGLAPMLIGSDGKSVIGLYSYLSVIVLGTIWIARHRRWEILTFLSLTITSFYSAEYFFSSVTSISSELVPSEFLALRFFAVFLITIFFLVNLMTVITNKSVTSADLITAGAIGLYTYGWINGLVPEENKGLVTAAAALFYSGASFVTFQRTALKQPVYIYTAIAVILLAIATAFLFDGPVLIIAFSIQALVLPIVGVRLLGADIGKYVLFYFVLPVFLSLEALLGYWPEGILHNQFYAVTVVTLSLIGSGVYFYTDSKDTNKILHNPATFLTVVGGVYGMLWIWKVFHAIVDLEYLATMATLIVYTAIGLFTYLTGEVHKRTVLNKFGLFTLIFVVGRLLIVDVWGMELTGKIITFFMVGILLAGSVLLRRTQVEKK